MVPRAAALSCLNPLPVDDAPGPGVDDVGAIDRGQRGVALRVDLSGEDVLEEDTFDLRRDANAVDTAIEGKRLTLTRPLW